MRRDLRRVGQARGRARLDPPRRTLRRIFVGISKRLRLWEGAAATSAGVRVCREPSQDALQLGMHSCGEFVLAQSQTYHGWIRLADDEGWMPALDVLGGARLLQNVRPEELQLASPGAAGEGQVEGAGNAEAEEAARAAAAEAARREALRALEAAAMSGANTANFCAAMEVARGRGVSKKDIARCNAMRTDR
mmetsp:Transcript_142794/g.455941  ORF Transcript_142794/g.455941 Transcript_142794/m.455941 type:complete len:192 (-) Transcript_142794:9-584(-)